MFSIYCGIYRILFVVNLVGGYEGGCFGVKVRGGNFYGKFNFKGSDLVGMKMLKCKKFLD